MQFNVTAPATVCPGLDVAPDQSAPVAPRLRRSAARLTTAPSSPVSLPSSRPTASCATRAATMSPASTASRTPSSSAARSRAREVVISVDEAATAPLDEATGGANGAKVPPRASSFPGEIRHSLPFGSAGSDSKSAIRKGLWVRVPPSVLPGTSGDFGDGPLPFALPRLSRRPSLLNLPPARRRERFPDRGIATPRGTRRPARGELQRGRAQAGHRRLRASIRMRRRRQRRPCAAACRSRS